MSDFYSLSNILKNTLITMLYMVNEVMVRLIASYDMDLKNSILKEVNWPLLEDGKLTWIVCKLMKCLRV